MASALFYNPPAMSLGSFQARTFSASVPCSLHSSRIFYRKGSTTNKCNIHTPITCGAVKSSSSPSMEHLESETMKLARKAFYEEISFRKSDEDISLAKAAMLISVEDEAFMLANRERDMVAMQKEGRNIMLPPKAYPTESLSLEGQSISYWLEKLDSLADTVKSSASYSHPIENLRQFTRRSSLTTDSRNFYLHRVLTLGAGTAIMIGIIYLEVCRRLGLDVKGASIGDDFFIWPCTDETKVNIRSASVGRSKMVFEPFEGGKIWHRNADGIYVGRGSSEVGPHPTDALQPSSNRTILTVLLRNMKRLYWKRAARGYVGTDIAAPLHPLAVAEHASGLFNIKDQTLLRPQDLRLAVAASEKLLLLQPQDWQTRRDHGLLLYHSRRYGEAVQELSICMAVAPVHEVQKLEPFVEKLHLLRVESSWAATFSPNAPSALA